MKDNILYIIHICECIERIELYLSDCSHDTFMASTLIQDAALRNLQTLAESTQRLSEDFKIKHPEVDWYKISGFRNVLVHDYLGVDLEMVWKIVERDLSTLKRAIKNILQEEKINLKAKR